MSRYTAVLVIALSGALNINSSIAQTYTTGCNRGRWEAHTGVYNHANVTVHQTLEDALLRGFQRYGATVCSRSS